jgi:hypothetical protein
MRIKASDAGVGQHVFSTSKDRRAAGVFWIKNLYRMNASKSREAITLSVTVNQNHELVRLREVGDRINTYEKLVNVCLAYVSGLLMCPASCTSSSSSSFRSLRVRYTP